MRLRRTSSPRPAAARGFTLIEMLIVIGVIALIAGFSLVVNLSDYQGSAFRAERTTLVTLLQTARADALNNVDQLPHGVEILPSGGYVVFEGSDYDPGGASNEAIPAGYPVAISALPATSQIVFCQLSGDAVASGSLCDNPGSLYDGTITLTDTERHLESTITINHEGAISW